MCLYLIDPILYQINICISIQKFKSEIKQNNLVSYLSTEKRKINWNRYINVIILLFQIVGVGVSRNDCWYVSGMIAVFVYYFISVNLILKFETSCVFNFLSLAQFPFSSHKIGSSQPTSATLGIEKNTSPPEAGLWKVS